MAVTTVPNRFARRAFILYALLIAAALVIYARLIYWQVLRFDDLSREASDTRSARIVEYARRGDIVTSDGMLLATDIYVYEVAAHPKVISDPYTLADKLAPLLNADKTDLVRRMLQRDQSTVMLTLSAPADVGPKLTELRDKGELNGIEFVAKPARRFPGQSFAAHVVGFVNAGRQGAYGLEQYYDEILRGRDGLMEASTDAWRDDSLPFVMPTGYNAVNGPTLVLTLNSAMQSIAERELEKGIRESQARSGQIVILEPDSGKILALASYPAPDLNAFATTKLDLYNNPAVSSQYEPGSVFKALTLAAGLDSGRVNRNSVFNDPGSIVVGGRTFRNHDRAAHGDVNLETFMADSLNVIAIKIALATGAKNFYQYLQNFGLGELTGVDLAGEITGVVKTPGDGIWYESDLASNAFGQGVSVTPVQLASALGAIANGGKLMRPYIVDRQIGEDGSIEYTRPRLVRQVLKPETAQTVTTIMSRSIARESSNKANLPGYSIAGKTGTAEIPIPGGYDPKWTIASFGGYFPADDPRFVILVKIDRPAKSPWGSQVASPVFQQVAQQLAQLVGLPPDAVRLTGK